MDGHCSLIRERETFHLVECFAVYSPLKTLSSEMSLSSLQASGNRMKDLKTSQERIAFDPPGKISALI